MKKYEKPLVELNCDLAEGIFAASGISDEEDNSNQSGGAQNPIIPPPVSDPVKGNNGNHNGWENGNNGNNGKGHENSNGKGHEIGKGNGHNH